MTKILCLRWVNITKPHKPHPVVGYSLHPDAGAARKFADYKMKTRPDFRPELKNDAGEFGARELAVHPDTNLMLAFTNAKDGRLWIAKTKQPSRSKHLGELQACLRANHRTENDLPIVLI